MGGKQLDFNAPLISVRRFSSKPGSSDVAKKTAVEKSGPGRQYSLPVCKSDWELSEVAKPGAVPFLWEQIPGKAKAERGIKPQPTEKPSSTPKLPPGKVVEALKQIPGKKSGDQNAHPSNTPRHAAGKALDLIKRISGKISGEQSFFRPQTEASSPFNDHATLLDILKDDINAKEESDFGSENDAFSDALDTLSLSESLSFNCSSSGLSGNEKPPVKPSGTFSPDAQTLDFMMSRFIPAAKAMVLETPKYVVPRKPPTIIECQRPQPAVIERHMEEKKVITRERNHMLEKYVSSIVAPYDQYASDVESQGEDNEYDDQQKKSAKACGLLPRICVKNSLLLLNPVPGVKLRDQSSIPSAREMNKKTRTFHSGPLDKHGFDAIYKKKFHSGNQSSQELPESRSKPMGESKKYSYSGILYQELPKSQSKSMGDSKKYSYSGEMHRVEGPPPYRSCRSGGISPYRNRPPQSPFHDGARFLGLPSTEGENVNANKASLSSKGGHGVRDKSQTQFNKQESGSVSPAVEKTVYVDSVRTLENPFSNSITRNAEVLVKTSRERNQTSENSEVKGTSKQNVNCQALLEGGSISKPVAAAPPKASLSSSAFGKQLKYSADRTGGLKLDQGLVQECKEIHPIVASETATKHDKETKDQENDRDGSLPSPLTPPLPKSPSESWLWRALPLRNPFSLATQLHSKKQGPKNSSAGTKWETIVKTSNVHHDHVRYSKELTPHVSALETVEVE